MSAAEAEADFCHTLADSVLDAMMEEQAAAEAQRRQDLGMTDAVSLDEVVL